MHQPTISFITYTYNDGDLAADLIRQAQDFSLCPDEYVVVDDGSDEPFVMTDAPDTLRILRFDENQGITRSKGAGLSAASGDFIFSMDCDTRVEPDWLERNLPHANVPSIGLTGGALVHNAGNDLVSRYLAMFGDNHNQHHIGQVDFIPGNAFLLRRAIWEEVGGFTEYEETNCQDHYLCNLLKKKGYTLYSDARAKAWQLRRISRTTMCKRVWKWCHKPIKRQAAQVDDVHTYLFGVLAAPMLERVEHATLAGEPLFSHLELVYLAYTMMDTLHYLASIDRLSPDECDTFIAGFCRMFDAYPRALLMVRADLHGLGVELRTVSKVRGSDWDDFFIFSDLLRSGGIFSWLDRQSVVLLARDDAEQEYDFSSYAATSFAV